MASSAGDRRYSRGEESDDPLDIVSPGSDQRSSSMSRIPSVFKRPTSPAGPIFGDTPVQPLDSTSSTPPLLLTRVISKGRRSISVNPTVDAQQQAPMHPQLQPLPTAGPSSANASRSSGERRRSSAGSGESNLGRRRRSSVVPPTNLVEEGPAPVLHPPDRATDPAIAKIASTTSPSSSTRVSDDEGGERGEGEDPGMDVDDQRHHGEGDEEGEEQPRQQHGDEGKGNSRGPNMNVNYKIKFQKARERYKRIQADSALLSKGLEDAQKKQRRLEDELNWLLDTLAARRPDLANLEH